jgi:hypothetical protein
MVFLELGKLYMDKKLCDEISLIIRNEEFLIY